jgi:2-polyprenyl-6-methoxyphenol hydroxylase-like FAD-dependent oxidoreductase
VYERDPSPEARQQGYRISVNADGLTALARCLPDRLFAAVRATSSKPARCSVVLDEQLRIRQMPLRPRPRQRDGGTGRLGIGVNRTTLRQVLLSDLEDLAQFDCSFEGFDRTPAGRIRAHFSDGRSAVGDLLVGADGVGSLTRQLIAPGAVIDEIRWALFGRTLLSSPALSWMPEFFIRRAQRILGPDGIGMSISPFRQAESFAGAREALPAVSLTDTTDYVMWTLGGRPGHPVLAGLCPHQASSEALHQIASRATAHWHPAVRRLIAEAEIPDTIPVRVRAARPVRLCPTPGVTLLGDAIHVMPPARGLGANIALRDAALLARLLADAVAGRTSLGHAQQRYESEMLQYGFEAVRWSSP